MSAVRYTDEQRLCIEQLSGPVDISAGAGSGKTFTLSQRIAYALSPESGSGIDDIDAVLAITFTDKAASEIKSRVRSTLRSRGLFDAALKVDSAWISTIHGMCSRILRSHALELGLDPEFSVIDDKDRRELLGASLNEVIGSDSEIISRTEFDALFEAFPARSVGFGGSSVMGMVEELIAKAAGMVDGFDGFRMAPPAAPTSTLAKRLLLAYEEMVIAYEGAKQTATLEKNRAKAEAAVESLQSYLVSGDTSLDGFIAVLDECDFLGKLRGTLVEETLDYQNIHAGIAQETYLAKARPLLDDVLALAAKAQAAYDARKRQAGVLDNDDLLKLALEALSDEAIARDYRDRFKLVMVDEFQDTSQLQIEIVRHLAGPGLRYLCTVGDAQQSIYRFRGADVNVYNAFRENLESPEIVTAGGTPALLELTSNFRSHADVLSFVKRVSSQEQVFGESFLDLRAVYDGHKYCASESRIQLIAATVPQGVSGKTADIVEAEAHAIAQYFCRMHEAGHPLSDMAVLLGRMAYAEVYAQAMRDTGFPCIIAGGSLFHKAHEVRVVERLLRVLADLNDTQALFEVLTSDMFELTADEMLELATGFDEDHNIPRNRDLAKGFTALTERAANLPTGLKHAVALMAKAQQEVRFHSASKALMDVLLDSGWVSRLEAKGAEGIAGIANILKAVRFIEAMETNRHFGIARCASEFSSMIADGMKEAPGALSVDGQEAVKIMTIHASKGLEFPLVALARFAKSASGPSNKLIAETIGNETYISLTPPASLLEKGSLSAKAQGKPYLVAMDDDSAFSADPSKAADLIGFHSALERVARQEAEAEEQRLFYVGATRAKESLAVVMGIKEQKTDPYRAYRGTLDDIRTALFGENLFPEEDCEVDFGGSTSATFSRVMVEAAQFDEGAGTPLCQQAGSCDEVGALGSVALPAIEPFELPATFVPLRATSGLFSYSSIAESHALDAAAVSGPDQFVADVDKATDFGSAFHRLAQLAARHDIAFSQARFNAVAATYGIKDLDRLKRAIDRWFASSVCQRALLQDEHRAEVPFCVSVGEEYLEGEIDLFCTDDGTHAFIVDYKTGGSPAETDEQLHEKHLLQAQCYAFATLGQGFKSVEFAFVRVEQEDPAGVDTLQAVPYRFEQNDLSELETIIADRAQDR